MTGAIIILALAALAFGPKLLRWKAQAARASELKMARLIQEPVFIFSQYVGDPDPDRKAHELKTLIVEAGNQWITPLDIYCETYDPNMANGKLQRMSFSTWRQQVEEERDKILAKWKLENATINDEIRAAILGQNGKSN